MGLACCPGPTSSRSLRSGSWCALATRLSDNSIQVHQNAAEPWRVTPVDTGAEKQTGGRIRRVGEYMRDDTFMLTYGDGVADVDIAKLLEFHRAFLFVSAPAAGSFQDHVDARFQEFSVEPINGVAGDKDPSVDPRNVRGTVVLEGNRARKTALGDSSVRLRG
jgi:hypothetical protein